MFNEKSSQKKFKNKLFKVVSVACFGAVLVSGGMYLNNTERFYSNAYTTSQSESIKPILRAGELDSYNSSGETLMVIGYYIEGNTTNVEDAIRLYNESKAKIPPENIKSKYEERLAYLQSQIEYYNVCKSIDAISSCTLENRDEVFRLKGQYDSLKADMKSKCGAVELPNELVNTSTEAKINSLMTNYEKLTLKRPNPYSEYNVKTFNGLNQSVIPSGFNKNTMDIKFKGGLDWANNESEIEKRNAGIYTLIVAPKFGYAWKGENPEEPIEIKYEIKKLRIYTNLESDEDFPPLKSEVYQYAEDENGNAINRSLQYPLRPFEINGITVPIIKSFSRNEFCMPGVYAVSLTLSVGGSEVDANNFEGLPHTFNATLTITSPIVENKSKGVSVECQDKYYHPDCTIDKVEIQGFEELSELYQERLSVKVLEDEYISNIYRVSLNEPKVKDRRCNLRMEIPQALRGKKFRIIQIYDIPNNALTYNYDLKGTGNNLKKFSIDGDSVVLEDVETLSTFCFVTDKEFSLPNWGLGLIVAGSTIIAIGLGILLAFAIIKKRKNSMSMLSSGDVEKLGEFQSQKDEDSKTTKTEEKENSKEEKISDENESATEKKDVSSNIQKSKSQSSKSKTASKTTSKKKSSSTSEKKTTAKKTGTATKKPSTKKPSTKTTTTKKSTAKKATTKKTTAKSKTK